MATRSCLRIPARRPCAARWCASAAPQRPLAARADHPARHVQRRFSHPACSAGATRKPRLCTLVVWRLDRLGRSLPDLVQIVAELEQQGVAFESLTEKIETSSAAGKLVFHVFAALAEFERNLIRERTHAGLAAARARGRKGGRKPALTPQQVREIKALLRDPSIPVASIADRYGVSRATIYKHAGADAPARHQSGPISGPAKGANRV